VAIPSLAWLARPHFLGWLAGGLQRECCGPGCDDLFEQRAVSVEKACRGVTCRVIHNERQIRFRGAMLHDVYNFMDAAFSFQQPAIWLPLK
jgi:hypothetical protein